MLDLIEEVTATVPELRKVLAARGISRQVYELLCSTFERSARQ